MPNCVTQLTIESGEFDYWPHKNAQLCAEWNLPKVDKSGRPFIWVPYCSGIRIATSDNSRVIATLTLEPVFQDNEVMTPTKLHALADILHAYAQLVTEVTEAYKPKD
jgi:hypothetical protein